jgi:hypothetical protein
MQNEIDFRMVIINGHRQGIVTNEIARITGYARSTCQRWVNRYISQEIDFLDLPEHSHHFLLDAPNGHESIGVCKICLEVKVHYNSTHVSQWSTHPEKKIDIRTKLSEKRFSSY